MTQFWCLRVEWHIHGSRGQWGRVSPTTQVTEFFDRSVIAIESFVGSLGVCNIVAPLCTTIWFGPHRLRPHLLNSCVRNGLPFSGLSVGIWHQHGWRGSQGHWPAVATWLWLRVWWSPWSTSNPVDRRRLECPDEPDSQTVSFAIPPFRLRCARACASAQKLRAYWSKIHHGRTGLAATALCSSCQLHRVPTLCSPVRVVRTCPSSCTGSATCPGNLSSAHVSALCFCFSSHRTVWAFGQRPIRGDFATGE